jgi:ABC-type branched-subunit amino acid transport system substrate-binding protein
VKRLGTLTAVVLVTIGLVVAGGIAGASTRAATSDKPTASDIGVSATQIHIAVIADVDNPFAPGLFQGSVDAVNGAAKTINQQGGIGGRKVVVDFIDSHLNPNESRNAVITACQNDFAMVGTAALFLTSVDDEISCKDQAGNAIGLPDIGGIVTGIPEQCSPVSYPAQPPQILCDTKDQKPQTYQGQQGAAKWFLKNINKNLKGPNILPNDTKDAYRGDKVQALINVQAGIKQTQEVTHSGKDPQSAYTSVVQQMKTDGSNFAFDGLAYANMIEVQQEAQLQGLTGVTWQCTTACYDPKYIQDGGSAAEGTYLWAAFLPFAEAKYNKALATMVKNVGPTKVTGLGLYSYTAGLAFQQVMDDVVAKQGVNAVTRQNLLDGLKKLTSFNAGGITGTVDIANKKTSPCYVLLQVKNGKFNRVWPTKKGTFDCTKSNYATVQSDLIGS